jgi:hypothetical protein
MLATWAVSISKHASGLNTYFKIVTDLRTLPTAQMDVGSLWTSPQETIIRSLEVDITHQNKGYRTVQSLLIPPQTKRVDLKNFRP